MSSARRECDVLVVGGGPAGIAAAARAAELGAPALIVDEGAGPGGQIWRPSVLSPGPRAARQWIARLDRSGAPILRSTAIVDLSAEKTGGFRALAESARGHVEINARTIILATGARERFLPFPGWTLQNVFGIGGAQALLKSGTPFHGRRVVIAGTGPLLLPVAAALAKAGAKIVLVAEQASLRSVGSFALGLWKKPATLAQAAMLRAAFIRTRYSTGTWITAARGDTTITSVTITDGVTTRRIECDVLCAAFGLVPNTELARLLGCATADGRVVVTDDQATTVAGVYCAGEPTGIAGVDLALVEGEIAGVHAAGRIADPALVARRRSLAQEGPALDAAFALRSELRQLATADTVVCRCEDVRLASLDRSWSARQAKLYTRAGMGPCQGRICGAALECIMGWPSDSIRPPTQPTRVASLLGYSRSLISTDHGAQ